MSTLIHNMTIYDPKIDDNISVSLYGEIEPGEKETYDNPGSDTYAIIEQIMHNNVDITDHFSEQELLDIGDAVLEDMNDSIDPDDDWDEEPEDWECDEAADRYFEHLYEPNY